MIQIIKTSEGKVEVLPEIVKDRIERMGGRK